MSSMPYAMKMVQSEKQRRSQKPAPPPGGGDASSSSTYSSGSQNPMRYNSNMMNSIWGMYNQYSVHSFKSKICDASQQDSQARGCNVADSYITANPLSMNEPGLVGGLWNASRYS